jgi:hypothetical protein
MQPTPSSREAWGGLGWGEANTNAEAARPTSKAKAQAR